MKKVLLVAMAAVTTLTFSGCSKKTETAQSVKLRVSDIHTEGYPTVVGLHEFARLVEERSKGRITVEVLPDGTEGDETTALEKVQFGKLDFTRVSISPLSTFDPVFETLVVPGVFRNEAHFWKVLDGEIGEKCLHSLERFGFYGLCYYDSGARSFYTKNRLYSFSDLQGKKIRTQQSAIMLEFMNALGAIPVPMGLMEIGPAVEKGMIDGAENNIPSYETTNQYQVAKFYFQDEHSRVADILVGSKKTLALLSEEDREMIFTAAKDSEAVQRVAWKEYEQKAIKKVTAGGAVIISPSWDDRQETLKKVQPRLSKRFSSEQLNILHQIEAVR